MCGRYVRRSDKRRIAGRFHAQSNPVDFPLPLADYNVAPTTHQPIIRQSRETGERELVLARWGPVPFFTEDLSEASLTYFLITRPSMRAERNEAANRLEGQFTPVYEELDSLSAIALPDTPLTSLGDRKIKGYFLGESWQELVLHSPNLQARVTDCATQRRPDLSKNARRTAADRKNSPEKSAPSALD